MLTKKLSQPDQDMPLIQGHKAALPQEDFHQPVPPRECSVDSPFAKAYQL